MENRIYSLATVITAVNDEFINFTGFTMGELVGKSLSEISHIIRFNLELNLDNINNKYSAFIFTKLMDAREVNISLLLDKEKNKKKYIFIEKPNSRFEDKFNFVEQICIENTSSVAIYSVPDLKLLKANKNYLNIMNPHFNKYENIIGRPIREIVTRYVEMRIFIWGMLLERYDKLL